MKTDHVWRCLRGLFSGSRGRHEATGGDLRRHARKKYLARVRPGMPAGEAIVSLSPEELAEYEAIGRDGHL
jgi:hypothetical protein